MNPDEFLDEKSPLAEPPVPVAPAERDEPLETNGEAPVAPGPVTPAETGAPVAPGPRAPAVAAVPEASSSAPDALLAALRGLV